MNLGLQYVLLLYKSSKEILSQQRFEVHQISNSIIKTFQPILTIPLPTNSNSQMQLQQTPHTHPNKYDQLQQQPEPMAIDPATVSQQSTLNQRYKSFYQILKVILNIGLSSFYFGYTLAYMSAVDFGTVVKIYHIEMDENLAEGLLIGCMPIGGGIGALASGLLINRFSRRNSVLIVNAIAFITGIFLFYPRAQTLLLCRIIQGLCAGFYSSLTPLIMKQLSPRQISGTLTSFNQISIAFGVFFAFAFSQIIQRIFNDPSSQKTWWIVFGFGIVIVTFQTFTLMTKYNFETPKYMYQKMRDAEGRTLLQLFYKPQHVDSVVQQILTDIGRNPTKPNSQPSSQQSNSTQTPRSAIIIAIHLAALQQFCGINAVVAYGGQIVGQDVPSLKLGLPIVINLVQVVAALFTSYLLTKMGRKILFQYGCIGASVSCFMIALGFWIKQSSQGLGLALIIIGLFLFMANFGLTLGPVVWVYLPEIVQSSVLPYATATNWGTASLITLLFPVIKDHLPKKNPAWLFMFFALWCVLSFVFNKKYLIETRNKTEKEISQEYGQVQIGC